MKKTTITAIEKRISNNETRFRIGAYTYECNINGIVRRREKRPGCLPTSDWEFVGGWNPETREFFRNTEQHLQALRSATEGAALTA